MNKYLKAIIGLAIPLLTAVLLGLSTGEWDYEQLGMLVGGLVTGLLVYLAPNQSRQDVAPDRSRKDDLYRN